MPKNISARRWRGPPTNTPRQKMASRFIISAWHWRGQGKNDDAFDQFFKSTWSFAWRSPGYFQLAQIACARGDFDAALSYDQDSLAANATNIRALALESAIYRHKGMIDQSRAALASITAIDHLDIDAMSERWMTGKSDESAGPLAATITAFPATGLEAAIDYINAGLWSDATAVLTEMIDAAPNKSKV